MTLPFPEIPGSGPPFRKAFWIEVHATTREELLQLVTQISERGWMGPVATIAGSTTADVLVQEMTPRMNPREQLIPEAVRREAGAILEELAKYGERGEWVLLDRLSSSGRTHALNHLVATREIEVGGIGMDGVMLRRTIRQ